MKVLRSYHLITNLYLHLEALVSAWMKRDHPRKFYSYILCFYLRLSSYHYTFIGPTHDDITYPVSIKVTITLEKDPRVH